MNSLSLGGLGDKIESHRFLVTVEKLGAKKTITPDFHGKFFPGRLGESALQKKFRSDRECENGLQSAMFSLVQQLPGERAAQAQAFPAGQNTQRPDLRDIFIIEL